MKPKKMENKYWTAYDKVIKRRVVHIQIGKDLISMVTGQKIKNFERHLPKPDPKKEIAQFSIDQLFSGLITLELNEEERRAMNVIHHALLRNGYTYIFQKVELKR